MKDLLIDLGLGFITLAALALAAVSMLGGFVLCEHIKFNGAGIGLGWAFALLFLGLIAQVVWNGYLA